MAYVYQHIIEGENNPFYIGIGTSADYERAYRARGRSVFWNSVAKKYGYSVQILFDELSWEDACKKEIELIKLFGRRNNNTGILVNMTDGGEGQRGFIMSEETKNKLRVANLGKKQSDETKEKRRILMLGNKRNLGKKASPETIEKLRIACASNNKGNKLSDEQKARISELNKGKKLSESHAQIMRTCNIGIKRTDEQKARLVASRKRYFENRRAAT